MFHLVHISAIRTPSLSAQAASRPTAYEHHHRAPIWTNARRPQHRLRLHNPISSVYRVIPAPKACCYFLEKSPTCLRLHDPLSASHEHHQPAGFGFNISPKVHRPLPIRNQRCSVCCTILRRSQTGSQAKTSQLTVRHATLYLIPTSVCTLKLSGA